MSDTNFEMLLLDWLGRSSMQNIDDPAQFATLLDIIGNVTMSDLAKKAACEPLLHIHKGDDYAETLLFCRATYSIHGQTEEDQDVYLGTMQTLFAKALHHCGEELDWLKDQFPNADDFELTRGYAPRVYIGACLASIANGDREFSDRFYSWSTLISMGEQYSPQNCSPFDKQAYDDKLAGAQANLAEQLGQAA